MELEQSPTLALLQTRKRKKSEPSASSPIVPLDELNEDLLEKVLACLPPSSFFRLRLVCKRWRCVETSTTFRNACSRIPLREPWFYMVGSGSHRSVVFDTSEGNWKGLNQPELLEKTCELNSIPVASSGGLVCFRTASGSLIVSNPVTGACRELPQVRLGSQSQMIHAIAMKCNPEDKHSYKLVMVSGEFPNVAVKVYESTTGAWEEIGLFRRLPDDVVESDVDENVYFLSKTGDVVATYMQRSPSKQYSSVMTVEGGEDVIHFLSPSGAIVACNLAQRSFFEYPRLLLPPYLDHSLDVVECNGEVFVVVLSDFLETASLRVWKFCKSDKLWQQVTAMPPSMSHEFYDRKMDINCVGFGETMFVCVNSNDSNGCFTCDLKTNQWIELPKCVLDGKAEEFMAAFCFQPRIEACV